MRRLSLASPRPLPSLKVQDKLCKTCIYRKGTPATRASIAVLEKEVADPACAGHFRSYRACHHAEGDDVCCRGFWNRHKDRFTLGQLAQRLGLVAFVAVDDSPEFTMQLNQKGKQQP